MLCSSALVLSYGSIYMLGISLVCACASIVQTDARIQHMYFVRRILTLELLILGGELKTILGQVYVYRLFAAICASFLVETRTAGMVDGCAAPIFIGLDNGSQK